MMTELPPWTSADALFSGSSAPRAWQGGYLHKPEQRGAIAVSTTTLRIRISTSSLESSFHQLCLVGVGARVPQLPW